MPTLPACVRVCKVSVGYRVRREGGRGRRQEGKERERRKGRKEEGEERRRGKRGEKFISISTTPA